MNYISTKDASKKWGVSTRLVQGYCTDGKIQGARKIGHQWMIPTDAPRPVDRRYQRAKGSVDNSEYKFPILVFSHWYVANEELNEEEQLLLEAQLLHYKGEYINSTSLCRKILSDTKTVHIQAGAYWAMAYNFLLLGQYTDVKISLEAMEAVSKNDPIHQEDYKLLIESLRFQLSRQDNVLLEINTAELSYDAIDTYMLLIMIACLFRSEQEHESVIRSWEVFCRSLNAKGITPAIAIANGTLTRICEKNGDTEGLQRHKEVFCSICVENNWIAILGKYIGITEQEWLAEKHGMKLAEKVYDIKRRDLRNWKIAFDAQQGTKVLPNIDMEEWEFLLLLTYKLSNRNLAVIKNMSEKEIRSKITELCNRLGASSKAALIEYIRKELLQNTI